MHWKPSASYSAVAISDERGQKTQYQKNKIDPQINTPDIPTAAAAVCIYTSSSFVAGGTLQSSQPSIASQRVNESVKQHQQQKTLRNETKQQRKKNTRTREEQLLLSHASLLRPAPLPHLDPPKIVPRHGKQPCTPSGTT